MIDGVFSVSLHRLSFFLRRIEFMRIVVGALFTTASLGDGLWSQVTKDMHELCSLIS